MSLKAIATLAPLVLGGFYMTGGLGGGWSREVGRPVDEVVAGLEDLDIREQPGGPGSDPARSGGIRPLFRMEKTDRMIRWSVMSGDKVATVMTAELEPTADGTRTRVTAHVERGDAPDDLVSPVFRSTGLTRGLFIAALEGELNELVQPATGDARRCLDLRDRAMGGADSPRPGPRPRDLRTAIGQTSQNVMRLHAFDAEWRRLGCAAYDDKNLEDLTHRSGDAANDLPMGVSGDGPPKPEINFTPGEPMIDPRPTAGSTDD